MSGIWRYGGGSRKQAPEIFNSYLKISPSLSILWSTVCSTELHMLSVQLRLRHHPGSHCIRLAHGSESAREDKDQSSARLIKKNHIFTYLFYIIRLPCMCIYAMELVGGQRTVCGSRLSPSTMGVLGIRLRSPALARN